MSKKQENQTPEEQLDEQVSEAREIQQISREELESKLNEAETKANQSWDQLLRLQAEMENLRRRTERDVANAHKYGLEKLVLELLPVLDSIERGLSIPIPNDAAKSVHEGMEMTLGVLLKALEKFGVKQVNPLGDVFNPALHQAISMKEDAAAQPNSVVEVLQKGYLLQDRLLRPAMVIVAKP